MGADAHRRLRQAEQAESFPVALRALPTSARNRLRAVYDVVRVIDDLGDEAEGDRTALLHDFAAELALVWTGTAAPREPVLRRLAPVARTCALPRAPFDDLITANLLDQRVTRYGSWDELLEYCRLSAVPIGRLVLAVFDVAADRAIERESDRVCTALQLLEHWQDVAEDRRRGRTYLPADDMAAFGVAEEDLDAPCASPALRRLIAHETARALALLDAGSGVTRRVSGWARLAVAGYIAGGRGAADGLRRESWDVLRRSPGVRRRDVARHLVAELIRIAA